MQKHTPLPTRSNRRHRRGDFARQATIDAFGRYAGALDQGDFEDRKPWEVPARAPGARVR